MKLSPEQMLNIRSQAISEATRLCMHGDATDVIGMAEKIERFLCGETPKSMKEPVNSCSTDGEQAQASTVALKAVSRSGRAVLVMSSDGRDWAIFGIDSLPDGDGDKDRPWEERLIARIPRQLWRFRPGETVISVRFDLPEPTPPRETIYLSL